MEKQDLRQSISEKRALLSKDVWKRLDKVNNGTYPRDRERFHPYQHRREYSPYSSERQKSPLEWRIEARKNFLETSLVGDWRMKTLI